jgi:integrase
MKVNEKHEIDIQERMDKAYELAKKWKIGILESPKGSGRWQVYFTDPNTKKQVHLFKTKNGEPLRNESQCQVLKIQLLRDGYNPEEFGKDKSFNFDVAARQWVKLSNTSEEWRDERRGLVEKKFIPFFGKTDIRKIPTIKIDEFQQSLTNKGLSPKYIKNVMGELKSFFLFNKKSIPELPEFRKIIVQSKPIKWLTEDDQDKVFEHIPEHHRPIFEFCRYYGCRLNEACGLRWDDIHQEHDPPFLTIVNAMGEHGNLKPTTKTKKIRILPIVPETAHLFEGNGYEYVFSRDGRPYQTRTMYDIWKVAGKKASIQINCYNGLRHSWACQRLNMGFSLDEIRSVLGHTSSEMTQRYAEYATEALAPVIRGKPISEENKLIKNNKPKLLELKGKLAPRAGLEPAT